MYIHDHNIPDIEEYINELNKDYNLLDVKKSNMDINQKHLFYTTPTNFHRKTTTEIHRNTRGTSKN